MDPSDALMSSCMQKQWSYRSPDPEFYGTSSPETISPASSMDFAFPVLCRSPGSIKPICSVDFGGDDAHSSSSVSRGVKGRRSRSKNPSKQRQRASEKEKLRMRDLTKALHHLRTYLPPSVAPAGQTLTKIETLRLAIRYISHLTELLCLSEETLDQSTETSNSKQANSLEMYQSYCQHATTPGCWDRGPGRRAGTQCYWNSLPVRQPMNTELDCSLFGTTLSPPVQDLLFKSSTEALLDSPEPAACEEPYQVYRKSIFCPTVAQEFGT